MSGDLLDYIKRARGNDMTDDQIKQELLNAGWQEENIKASFKEADELEAIFKTSLSGVSDENEIKEKKEFKLPVFKIAAAVIASLLLGGGAFAIYTAARQFDWEFMSPKPEVQDQPRDQVQDQPPEEEKLTEEEALKDALKCGAGLMEETSETDRVLCFENIFRNYEGPDICVRIDQSSMEIPNKYPSVDGGSCYAGMAIARNDETLCNNRGGTYSGVCGAVISMEKSATTSESQLAQCGIYEDCYKYIFSRQNYDEGLCEKIQNKNECYIGAALNKKDETVCLKIESEMHRSSCLAGLGELKGDENLCAQARPQDPKAVGSIPDFMTSEGENCYLGIAVSKKEPALCGKINNPETKNFCYARIIIAGQDPASCSSLSQKMEGLEAKDVCYSFIAAQREDENLCASSSDSMKILCYEMMARIKLDENLCEQSGAEKDSCYLYMAKIKEDENICEKAGSQAADCYFYMAKMQENENICAKSGIRSSECYFNIARAKKDDGLCLKISELDKTDYSQANCYLALGEIKLDENLCKTGKEKSSNVYISENCFKMVAVAKGDHTICENINNKYGGKYACYSAVAKALKDGTLCEKNSAAYKPQCYYGVAVAKEDEALCEKAGTSKTICYSQIAVLKKDVSLCAKAGTYKITCEKEVGK